ncbi:MAG: GNAT family N-acetyltransferase [Chlorobia bacterium]|nr:GNAT family N-acetyltransferase [Fimbriimonadaceae bacterium]
MVLFETNRLLARRLTKGDVESMFAVYGDHETVRYVGDSVPLDRDGCRRWLTVTDRNFAQRGYGMFAIVDRESKETIGFAGIVHPGQSNEPEVKYAFRKDKWGKGYATEILKGLVAYAQYSLGLPRLVATVFPENAGSKSVLGKAGFIHSEDRCDEDQSITQVWELVQTASPK